MGKKKKAVLRKNLLQISALAIAVAIVVAGILVFQRWWESRPGPDPSTITITATADDEELELPVYQACDLAQEGECEEADTVPQLHVAADGEVTLTVPSSVSDYNWDVVAIYDDPAANSQFSYGAKESSTSTVPATVEATDGAEAPKLTVLEASALLIGEDANGEETPVHTVWSVEVIVD